MTRKKISDALTNIDAKYIEESAHFIAKKRHSFRFFLPIAACLCIVIGLAGMWKFARTDDASESQKEETISDAKIIVTDKGVSLPQLIIEPDLIQNNTAAADMIGFFIYQGRSYVQYEWLENGSELVGEYLGTSNGGIDEWTEPDSYIENSGSISGDFYAVNGYDPTFMLCMKYEDGTINTFINNNGFTVKYGYEIFEEKLHLSDHYTEVSYQTRNDWNYDTGSPVLLSDEYSDVVQKFVSEINQAEWMLLSDIPLEDSETNVYDSKEIYHMYFHMENGTMIHLRLFKGGYVSFQGIHQICVQIDETVFNELIHCFEN